VAVEVEQVEGKVCQPLGAGPLAHRLGQQVDMGDAALGGHRDLAVEDQRRQPGGDQLVERRAKQRGAVVAAAADQLDVTGDDRQELVPSCFTSLQPALAVRRQDAGGNDLQRDALRQFRRDHPGGQWEGQHGARV
jgi:hypothetical protein